MKALKKVPFVGLAAMLCAASAPALADDIYHLTIQLQGDSRCGGQAVPRPLFAGSGEVKIPSPFGWCTGPLQPDGSFDLVCNHIGTAPSTKWSGKISGERVDGELASELYVARGGGSGVVDIKCSGSFHGQK